MVVDRLHRPFLALLTVPTGIALSMVLLAYAVNWVDAAAGDALDGFLPTFDRASADAILGVVATAAMTALSLAYSLVLVVFTLAAGNIGPRLLKRFTTEPVNQITAGILGGTFLFALFGMTFVNRRDVPDLTVTTAVALGIVSVLQLIYFVRHVSQSVTIDDEIAQISRRLTHALDAQLERAGGADDGIGEFPHEIEADSAGYVGSVDEEALIALAAENDAAIRLEKKRGEFVLEGEALLASSRRLSDDTRGYVRACVIIEPARSADNTVEFSLDLLVEIALRALSPGVNDTYTAIAAVDSISTALARLVSERPEANTRLDGDGEVRLVLMGLSVKELAGRAFHPLRHACADNVLMAHSLARAYGRLYQPARAGVKTMLVSHAGLLVRELERAGHFAEDIESVRECFPPALRRRVTKAFKA